MKQGFYLLVIMFICSGAIAQPSAAESKYPLIPYPTSLHEMKGNFIFSSATHISSPTSFTNEIGCLQALSTNLFGKKIIPATAAYNTIELQKDNSINAAEGYRISINSKKVVLSAKYPAGMFRAVQTLRQLLPIAAEGGSTTVANVLLPAIEIADEPAFNWRGMHLDVARHFFSIGYLKKMLDVMALYKMNKFHLHLTDDQGWRIEIKKYPKLTSQGAWRTFNQQDSVCIKAAVDNPDMAIDTAHIYHKDGKTMYGGFYTQQQIKELVAYAAAKYIDIIPEIDMPGHMMAAINAYPFLSCNGQPGMGATFSTPICPCNPATIIFAENVFSEIFDLFPSEYIHLGADEVEKKSWSQSAACLQLMQKEGLKDVDELQSYFVRRMEKFFQSKGKKLIGWDEILEGGISPSAIIMYWRSYVSTDIPVKAVKNGNSVIMTPGNPLYFDNPEDSRSLKDIYDFKVVNDKLDKEEAKRIIGAQANIWTEEVPSENRADFLLMPRMTALAERLWSNSPGYEAYIKRLKPQYKRLDALHVHYRLPNLPGMVDENVFIDSAVLEIKHPIDGLTIRYTIDGSVPVASSPVLNPSLMIKKEALIKLAAYAANGLRGDVYTLHYKKDSYANPVANSNTTGGLTCSYFKKFYKSAVALGAGKPDSTFTTNDFIVPASVNAPSFGLQYDGYINVPEAGIYTFYLTCDDGGILTIADRQVVNNDGLHPAAQKTGQVALRKGMHPFRLAFIEGGGGYKLQLQYSTNQSDPIDIPESWLKH